MVWYKSNDTKIMDVMFNFIFVPLFDFIKCLYIINSKVVCFALCQEYEHLMEESSRILFKAIMHQKKKYSVRILFFYIYIE